LRESGYSDLEVDQEGNIYLLWPEKHKLIKLFKLSDYDSIQTIGGKGMAREGFNFPSKIVVPNRQSIFLLDQMNRRIMQFNTNLKIIDDVNFLTLEIPGESETQLWPISFAVGPAGDLFLLNQEDLRVYKITPDGILERTFGGLDFGAGSVQEPWDLTINENNMVFCIDSTNQEVLQFDLFGTFRSRIAPTLPFRWHHMVAVERALVFVGTHELHYFDWRSLNGTTVSLGQPAKVLDLAMGRDYLYLLFENRVDLYPLK
jgi:hypothetical protein